MKWLVVFLGVCALVVMVVNGIGQLLNVAIFVVLLIVAVVLMSILFISYYLVVPIMVGYFTAILLIFVRNRNQDVFLLSAKDVSIGTALVTIMSLLLGYIWAVIYPILGGIELAFTPIVYVPDRTIFVSLLAVSLSLFTGEGLLLLFYRVDKSAEN